MGLECKERGLGGDSNLGMISVQVAFKSMGENEVRSQGLGLGVMHGNIGSMRSRTEEALNKSVIIITYKNDCVAAATFVVSGDRDENPEGVMSWKARGEAVWRSGWPGSRPSHVDLEALHCPQRDGPAGSNFPWDLRAQHSS